MLRFDFKGFRHFRRRRFWAEFWSESQRDHVLGMAAELSYYFLLAFFPFLIFVSDIIIITPIEPQLMEKILNELSRFLPRMTLEEIVEVIDLRRAPAGSLWSFIWMAVSLYAASLGLLGTAGVLNRAYRTKETRPYWRVHLRAALVTVGVSLLVIVAAILLFFGDDLTAYTLDNLPLDPQSYSFFLLGWIYGALRWILIFLFFNLGIQIVYYSLPARRLPWRLLSPGSVVAALGWVLGSLIFSFVVNQSPTYGLLYGSLKGLVVLMVWFYLCSLLLLLGGEIDSEIFRMRRGQKKRPPTAKPQG